MKKDLLQRTDPFSDNYTITISPAKRDEIFRSVDLAHCAIRSLVYPTTPKAYVKLIQTCEQLALRADLASGNEPYIDFFVVDLALRCQLAVDIALPAKSIRRDAPLITAGANHLSDKSIYSGLRYINFQSTEIALDERRRRITLCYMDFADLKGT